MSVTCSRRFMVHSHLSRCLWTRLMSSEPIITIKQARENLMSIVGAQKTFEFDSKDKPVGQTASKIKESPNDLPVRRMKDSYKEAVIPLESNSSVREKYINFHKGIRFGRILENLDTFAGYICYIHYKDPDLDPANKAPIGIVTALVDRIEMKDQIISPYQDIKMSGQVTWTGSSSMEVTMELEQEVNNTWQKLVNARFVMVARNPHSHRAAAVNRLVPEGPEEQAVFDRGEAAKQRRKEEALKSLLRSPPSPEERLVIHDLFLKTVDEKSGTFKARIKPEGTIWMEKTVLKNMIMCHPEQRNIHNKIFGGFLMRQAMEVAWTNAALYCRGRPVLKVVDDIVFKKSVEIGALLMLSSQVVFTDKSMMQVKVHAEALDVKTGERETTNDFYFTFDSNDENLPAVIPKSYSESMLYLDGKRHYES